MAWLGLARLTRPKRNFCFEVNGRFLNNVMRQPVQGCSSPRLFNACKISVNPSVTARIAGSDRLNSQGQNAQVPILGAMSFCVAAFVLFCDFCPRLPISKSRFPTWPIWVDVDLAGSHPSVLIPHAAVRLLRTQSRNSIIVKIRGNIK